MGTHEARWALVPFRLLVAISVVLVATPCRSATLPGEKLPKAPPDEAVPAWERELREKLSKPVTVEFREATLAEACQTLGKLADVPIRIDPAVAVQAKPITLPKMTLSAEHALRWVCRFNLCRYVLRDGAVLVVPRPTPVKLLTRDYDISDLLRPPVRAEEQVWEKSLEEPTGRGWCRYIRSVVAPGTWDEAAAPADTCDINYRNERLIVIQSEAVQKEIAALLDAHRKTRDLQVHVFGRFMTADRAVFDALKLEWLPRGAGKAGAAAASYAPLRKEQAEALLEAVVKKHRGTLFGWPRATCHDGQLARLQAVLPYSRVRTIRGEAEPEISSVPEGIIVNVQPFISSDRKSLTLLVEEPIRTPVFVWRDPAAEAGPPPFDALVTVPDGGTVLFSRPLPRAATGKADGTKDRTVEAMVLTAEVVPDIFEE